MDDPIEQHHALAIAKEVVIPPSKKRKVVKTVDDSIPLPEPYPLPKHFKSDVETDLKSGKMSFNSHRVFMSHIASSMLAFKKYPTRDDYANVARTILKEYPFFKSAPGSGTPYVSYMYMFRPVARVTKRGVTKYELHKIGVTSRTVCKSITKNTCLI